jgi:hypothetical protein
MYDAPPLNVAFLEARRRQLVAHAGPRGRLEVMRIKP